MSDIIQWARLNDPGPAVSQLQWPEPSYMYLERVPEGWLDPSIRESSVRMERLDSSIDFKTWERGRIFCDTFELRWEKVDGMFHLVYTGTPTKLKTFQETEEPSLSSSREASYYLWGTRVATEDLEVVGAEEHDGQAPFVELAIPRILYYPVSQENRGQRIKIKVCEYVDEEDGRLLYYRFRSLEEVPRS